MGANPYDPVVLPRAILALGLSVLVASLIHAFRTRSRTHSPKWVIAGDGQLRKDDHVRAVGNSQMDELRVIFTVALNIAFD